MRSLIRDMGLLRAMLYAAAVLVIILSPTPGMRVDIEWPAVLTTMVVPALAPLIFMVIAFDLIMSRVVAKGSAEKSAPPLPKFFWIGVGLALIILIRWLPYLLSLSA